MRILKLCTLCLLVLFSSACDRMFLPVDKYDTDTTYSGDSNVENAVERERYEEWREPEESKPVRDYFKY